MRDRLTKLLKKAQNEWLQKEYEHEIHKDLAEYVADHLLAEGVIVPPYKPLPLIDEGDRMLCPECETDLMGYYFDGYEAPEVITCVGCGAWLNNRKAVTREEAERL